MKYPRNFEGFNSSYRIIKLFCEYHPNKAIFLYVSKNDPDHYQMSIIEPETEQLEEGTKCIRYDLEMIKRDEQKFK